MSYDAMELSVEAAIRVEIYTVTLPSETYRLTDFDEDVTFDGNTYTATAIGRGQAPLVPLGKTRELTITIALDHPLAQALRGGGIPPQNASVTVRRFHLGDTEARPMWTGYIAGLSTDGAFARLRVPNHLEEALECQLPILLAQRTCSHVLYDVGCGVVSSSFRITPTVSSISGATLVVSSIGGNPDDWATFGKVVRVLDGAQRSILDQAGTTLVLDYPFGTLSNGDTLEVYAGCDHTIGGPHGCSVKFNNAPNFGGDPDMPINNPSAPTGYGIASQV